MRNNRLIILATLLVFVFIYGFLISQIPWDLIFTDTIVSGGDTGSHNYIARYAHEIFPKIKWWSSSWTAGFPFLYFYQPFLYYLTGIFAFFFPINIVFKIITLLGTFCFPVAIFLCLKLLKFEFPIPQIGALFSLSYLFLEKFSIYGGNIPSTLSGEFSYSLSFALFFIFIGLLYRGIRENRYLLANISILSLMALIHPFPVAVAVLVGLLIFFTEGILVKKMKQTFLYLLKVYGSAFFLTAFWSLPFLSLLSYTVKMSWTRTVKLEEIFPSALLPMLIFACFGILYFLLRWKKEKRLTILFLIIIAGLIPYLSLNHASIFNARFLPFIIVGYLLIAAYGLGSLLNLISSVFKKSRRVWFTILSLIFISVVLTCFYLPKNISYIPFWLKWNYEGFENKTTWVEIEPLFEYLKTLPYGRVMLEYRPEYDKFGTPRIFENLPIFSNKPTFEGLLTESSINSYFHFINQTETSHKPSAAIAGFEYPPFNFENGVKHIELFGARYFLAFTPEIKQLANQYLIKLKNVGEFTVYEVPNSELVTLIPRIELRPKNKNWLDESIDWYKSMDFSKFIVFYRNNREFKDIEDCLKNNSQSKGLIIIKDIKKDSLSFETENLYKPHLIKISYFPGWQVKGASGPYLVSPSFMMVIPFENEVTLEYSYNVWDKIGFTVSILSLIIFILVVLSLLPF
jgi:uncharacterized membrane protein